VFNPKNNMIMRLESFLQASAVGAFLRFPSLVESEIWLKKRNIEKLAKPFGLSFGVCLRRT
jgi:hypothetical protein